MSERLISCDLLVIGAGPAGLAAADCAAQSGLSVTIVDDNPAPGGQIWRGEQRKPSSKEAQTLFQRIQNSNVRILTSASVFHQPEAGTLLAERSDGVYELRYGKLAIAAGARERFLPFPGWTLPNVMGAGGLQALVKSGLSIEGKKVVVAGSGPLLLAVAAYLRRSGAEVLLIAEQAPLSRLLSFAVHLTKEPRKVIQAIKFRSALSKVKYLTGCWPVEALGEEVLSGVTLRQGERSWRVSCDFLACGFHLVPNLELALLLGCEIDNGTVWVDDFQKTSLPNTYCAGEQTGIGGLELSVVEGQISGYAAADNPEKARRLFSLREKQRRFAAVLNRTFKLRDELKALPAMQTIVCRCEDVIFGVLREFDSWRAAKLQSRCGMGPCQGRVCGGALEFLMDWRLESVRPPIMPVKVGSLTSENGHAVAAEQYVFAQKATKQELQR